jgi:hypothetical protein
MAMAYIETLKAKDAEGTETYIYPRTSTSAVVDENNNKLSNILEDLQTNAHKIVFSTTEPTSVEEGSIVFVYE